MREIIAGAVCVLTVCVVVALSFLFATAHNPRFPATPVRLIAAPAPVAGEANVADSNRANRSEPRQNATPTKPGSIDRGRAVYAQQNCSTCHSIAGVGNPRYPLDGVGARWDAAELRAWIVGTGVAVDILPASIVKRKQRYQSMPEDDLTALVAFLASLKPAR